MSNKLAVALVDAMKVDKYKEALEQIVKFEKKHKKEFQKEFGQMFWDYTVVGVDSQILYQLWKNKILIFPLGGGGKRKAYALTDMTKTDKALRYKPPAQKEKPKTSKPAKHKYSKKVFDTIVGADDIKEVILLSLDSLFENNKQMHVLLVGPPASAKTLFLLCLEKLEHSDFVIGGSASRAGITQQLFNKKPKLILIDEIEKMPKEEMSVFLSLMDGGRVSERKFNRQQDMVLMSNVYASCNSIDGIPKELLSRFGAFIFKFKKYTKMEFIKVCIKVLTKLEGVNKDLAAYIAGKMVNISRDVRESIGIGRAALVSNTPMETVDFLIKTKQKYSKE